MINSNCKTESTFTCHQCKGVHFPCMHAYGGWLYTCLFPFPASANGTLERQRMPPYSYTTSPEHNITAREPDLSCAKVKPREGASRSGAVAEGRKGRRSRRRGWRPGLWLRYTRLLAPTPHVSTWRRQPASSAVISEAHRRDPCRQQHPYDPRPVLVGAHIDEQRRPVVRNA